MRYSIVVFILIAISFGQDVKIKTLEVYSGTSRTQIPIIESGSKSKAKLYIEFDVDSENIPDLTIRFKFCDINWKPYTTPLLNNPGKDADNMLDYKSLPLGNDGADWHCKKAFPNQFVTFPYAGKWIFEIVNTFDYEEIYYTGKFYVVSQEVEISTFLSTDQIDGTPYSQNSLNRTLRLESTFDIDEEMDPNRIKGLEIIENKNIPHPIKVLVNENSDTRYYEWSVGNNFLFVARDIRPSNENRQIDMMSITKFGQYEVDAQFDGPDLPYFFKRLPRDYNGGYKLKPFTNPYANYMDVKFQLKTDFYDNRDVFLVGSFTDWKVQPKYKMDYVDGSYETYIILKRGIYDYKYVTGLDAGEKIIDIDWCEIDGNHLSTTNYYHIFLFYNTEENGGYDKIIGYKKRISGKL